LGREQDNVPELSDMSILGLLFQCAGAKKWIQISVLVLYKVDLIIISLKLNLLSPWYSGLIAELALNNNHSLVNSDHLW
jgi:type III secretory pathway component EscS